MPETRGLCLSEEQTVRTVRKRSKGNWSGNMITEQFKLTRRCEVTAILILFGLPRLLTGSILAHEMMHAWMRLKGEFLASCFLSNCFSCFTFVEPLLHCVVLKKGSGH